jgi:hypothetical protein
MLMLGATMKTRSVRMPSTSLTAFSADLAAIANQASQSSVALHHRGHYFSGFYWRPDVIATAAELLSTKQGGAIEVLTPSQEVVEGTVIGRDPATDVALIRVQKTAPVVSPSSAAPALGALVLASGRTRHGATCAAGSSLAGRAGGACAAATSAPHLARCEIEIPRRRRQVLDAAGQFIGMAVFGPRRRVRSFAGPSSGQDRSCSHGKIRRPTSALDCKR